MKRVFVGLSGGVDSSVAAALLRDAGYQVTGVYMKNWTIDLPGLECQWAQDFRDAKRVAVRLGIDFKVYDFQAQYRAQVVDDMVADYKAGRTPNPDIRCNERIKFKLFLEAATADGADYIATGHYARVKKGRLLRAADENKDQTYFLYRVAPAALKKCLFPIGDYQKSQVRRLAKQYGLSTASKPDSVGICFVGRIGIKQFLLSELGPQPSGPIKDDEGRVVGTHDGAIFYTIGQRHGLGLGGGLPYYVTAKDIESNTVFVTRQLDSDRLWQRFIKLTDQHWLSAEPKLTDTYQVRLRHRGPLVPARYAEGRLELAEEQRGIAPGQSAVLYSKQAVVGGGLIS